MHSGCHTTFLGEWRWAASSESEFWSSAPGTGLNPNFACVTRVGGHAIGSCVRYGTRSVSFGSNSTRAAEPARLLQSWPIQVRSAPAERKLTLRETQGNPGCPAEGRTGARLVPSKGNFVVETSRATAAMFQQHQFNLVYHETDGAHTWDKWREYLNEFAPQLFR
jgi:hypothetical protein